MNELRELSQIDKNKDGVIDHMSCSPAADECEIKFLG